jgi:phenylacetate-coenzyme A ligase PaaK-like adenylate-forming protein
MREYLTLHQLKHMRWETIERLQQQRFKAIAHHMLPAVKAYRDLFRAYGIDPLTINRVEDWKKRGLPLLKKAYYKEHPEDFLVRVHPSQAFKHHQAFLQAQESAATAALFLKALTHRKALEKEIKQYYFPKMPAFSGGTESGRPTPVFITARQKDTMAKILEIAVEIIFNQYKPKGDLVGMNLFPYAPHLGWHAVHMALDLAADLNLCTAAGGAIPTEKLVEFAEATHANIYAGMSDYLRNRWLPVAIEKKAKLPEQAMFINGAQKMHEGERQKIAELARKVGVKEAVVLDIFGASELKEDLLPECAPGTGFHHIAPLSNIIRTVRTEGATTKAGWIEEWDFVPAEHQGYGVIWNIDGGGTLLEGYLVGDVYEKITRKPCGRCGLKAERIFNVSRIKETEAQLALTGMVEAKVKGTRINLAAIRGALLKLPEVAEVQVVSRKAQLVLRIAPATSKQRAEPKVRAALQRLALEVTPTLAWTTVEKLTAGDALKFKGIVIES